MLTPIAQQYGDILSLKVMHLDIIVLSSPSAVKELIDNRSSSTSDRPTSIITDMIIPNGTNIGAAKCGTSLHYLCLTSLLFTSDSK